mmetsp:Transcript_20947/g.53553  ORF Transcript_20947/g.53553 Transcript_20947/m.53553 type:complete len:229 (-) Transcript_20947:596-1282(-)
MSNTLYKCSKSGLTTALILHRLRFDYDRGHIILTSRLSRPQRFQQTVPASKRATSLSVCLDLLCAGGAVDGREVLGLLPRDCLLLRLGLPIGSQLGKRVGSDTANGNGGTDELLHARSLPKEEHGKEEDDDSLASIGHSLGYGAKRSEDPEATLVVRVVVQPAQEEASGQSATTILSTSERRPSSRVSDQRWDEEQRGRTAGEHAVAADGVEPIAFLILGDHNVFREQ